MNNISVIIYPLCINYFIRFLNMLLLKNDQKKAEYAVKKYP